MVPIYLFILFHPAVITWPVFAKQLKFLGADARDDVVYLIRQFKDILESFFRGQLLIGFFMGIGYAFGFSLSGLKFGIALGLLFGVLNVVPYLGSILGIVGTLLVSYLQPGGILESGSWECSPDVPLLLLWSRYWKVIG